jgi:hypothetical protein
MTTVPTESGKLVPAERAGVNEVGLAGRADLWERVDALGDKRYYTRVEMAGMP